MRDLLPHFNNVLTLLNLLAENGEEQRAIKLGYDRAWTIGDYAAAAYLGAKLEELGEFMESHGIEEFEGEEEMDLQAQIFA